MAYPHPLLCGDIAEASWPKNNSGSISILRSKAWKQSIEWSLMPTCQCRRSGHARRYAFTILDRIEPPNVSTTSGRRLHSRSLVSALSTVSICGIVPVACTLLWASVSTATLGSVQSFCMASDSLFEGTPKPAMTIMRMGDASSRPSSLAAAVVRVPVGLIVDIVRGVAQSGFLRPPRGSSICILICTGPR